MGRRGRSEVRGSHLSDFQVPITTLVNSGTFDDCELPCDTKVHEQMHVKVGVIEESLFPVWRDETAAVAGQEACQWEHDPGVATASP